MIVYLDMDGVIANFFEGFAEKNGVDHWKEIEDVEASIKELAKTDFFGTLDKYPTAVPLLDFVKEHFGDDWGICSSPLRGDTKNSAFWKEEWLKKEGFMPQKENLIFTHNKPKFATKNGFPNILIDDKPLNIKKWQEAGGIGIRYQANEDSLQPLLVALMFQKALLGTLENLPNDEQAVPAIASDSIFSLNIA